MSQGLPGHHDDPHAALRERALQVRTRPPADGEPVASPCVSVCRLDPDRIGCEGCLRTLGEIRAWKAMDDAQRLGVWQLIEERLALADADTDTHAVQETPAP